MKLGIIIDNFSIFVQNNPTKKVSTVTATHPARLFSAVLKKLKSSLLTEVTK